MIQQLGAATRTLSGSQNNLFETIDNLQQFTAMLKDNNEQVRHVTSSWPRVRDSSPATGRILALR